MKTVVRRTVGTEAYRVARLSFAGTSAYVVQYQWGKRYETCSTYYLTAGEAIARLDEIQADRERRAAAKAKRAARQAVPA